MTSPEIPRADPNTGEHSAFRRIDAEESDTEPVAPEPATIPEQTSPRERWSMRRVGNAMFNISMRLIYGDLKHLTDWHTQPKTRPIEAPLSGPSPNQQPLAPAAPNQQYRIPQQRQPARTDHSGVLQL